MPKKAGRPKGSKNRKPKTIPVVLPPVLLPTASRVRDELTAALAALGWVSKVQKDQAPVRHDYRRGADETERLAIWYDNAGQGEHPRDVLLVTTDPHESITALRRIAGQIHITEDRPNAGVHREVGSWDDLLTFVQSWWFGQVDEILRRVQSTGVRAPLYRFYSSDERLALTLVWKGFDLRIFAYKPPEFVVLGAQADDTGYVFVGDQRPQIHDARPYIHDRESSIHPTLLNAINCEKA